MPLYEYHCAACGKRFELIQKFSAPLEIHCIHCGKMAQRLLSAPAVRFKGSGWYATDYARQPAPAETSESKTAEGGKPAEGGQPTEAGSPGGDSKSSDTSTASKSAAKKSSASAPSGGK